MTPSTSTNPYKQHRFPAEILSHGAAARESLPGGDHRQHRYLNNHAETSHQPTRQRERRRQQSMSPELLQPQWKNTRLAIEPPSWPTIIRFWRVGPTHIICTGAHMIDPGLAIIATH
jgi:hypothetical protein